MIDFSAGEDLAGFVVPRWRVTGGDGVDAVEVPKVCLAPWRPAPGIVVDLLIERVGVERSDLVVDLGSGDGCVLVGLASRTGCRGLVSRRRLAWSRVLGPWPALLGLMVRCCSCTS